MIKNLNFDNNLPHIITLYNNQYPELSHSSKLIELYLGRQELSIIFADIDTELDILINKL